MAEILFTFILCTLIKFPQLYLNDFLFFFFFQKRSDDEEKDKDDIETKKKESKIGSQEEEEDIEDGHAFLILSKRDSSMVSAYVF